MVGSGSKSVKGGGGDERLGDIEDVMREKKWNGVCLAENSVIKKVFDLFLRGPWPEKKEALAIARGTCLKRSGLNYISY